MLGPVINSALVLLLLLLPDLFPCFDFGRRTPGGRGHSSLALRAYLSPDSENFPGGSLSFLSEKFVLPLISFLCVSPHRSNQKSRPFPPSLLESHSSQPFPVSSFHRLRVGCCCSSLPICPQAKLLLQYYCFSPPPRQPPGLRRQRQGCPNCLRELRNQENRSCPRGRIWRLVLVQDHLSLGGSWS